MFDKLKKAGKKLADGAQDAVEEFKDKDCDWRVVGDGYATECDQIYSASQGPLADTYFNYCPFCGKKIEWEK